jgi:hypothetical protein
MRPGNLPRSPLGTVFRFGLDLLSAVIDATTKTIRYQVGVIAPGTPSTGQAQQNSPIVLRDNVEAWGCGPGFWSLPAAPTPGKSACQAIAIPRGDRDCAIGWRDLRANAIYGNLGAGDSCMGETGQLKGRVLCKGKDGSVWLYTNGASGSDMSVCLIPAQDSIVLQTKWGRISIDSTGITLASAGGAALVLDQTGKAKMTGQIVQCQANGVAQFTGPTGFARRNPGSPASVANTPDDFAARDSVSPRLKCSAPATHTRAVLPQAPVCPSRSSSRPWVSTPTR